MSAPEDDSNPEEEQYRNVRVDDDLPSVAPIEEITAELTLEEVDWFERAFDNPKENLPRIIRNIENKLARHYDEEWVTILATLRASSVVLGIQLHP